jgi:hypothetical protein
LETAGRFSPLALTAAKAGCVAAFPLALLLTGFFHREEWETAASLGSAAMRRLARAKATAVGVHE